MTSESATSTWRSHVGRFRPYLDIAPIALLIVIALWEIIAISTADSNVASDSEWAEAATTLKQEWRVGDLVVFAPSWVDPVGRLHVGELLTIDDAARMDADRYQVVWELSIRGARAPESRERTLESERHFGSLRLRKWVATPVSVATDFRQQFNPSLASGGFTRRPRLSLEEVGFEPHRCILAIPRPDQTVTIRYSGVELGSRIVLYGGLADVFTRRDIRDPGRIDVVVDGEPLGSIEVGVDDGWERLEIPTSPSNDAVVEFRLTAVGQTAKDRRICFAAEARH